MTKSLLFIVLILGLHYKYIQLWYGNSGGLPRYWRRSRNDSPLKQLGKASLIASLAFALLAANGTSGLFFIWLYMAFGWQPVRALANPSLQLAMNAMSAFDPLRT